MPEQRVPDTQPGVSNGPLPNLLVIGAMKAGTSALHYYLDLHPETQMSRPKELDFFAAETGARREDESDDPSERRIIGNGPANWERGLDWYSSHFTSSAALKGEASPSYTAPWQTEAAERIASSMPAAKLIFIARDPLERMVSEYQHYVAHGLEQRSPADAFAGAQNLYLERSRYWSCIQPFAERFPKAQVLVLSSESLLRERREALRDVYRFCEIDEAFWSPKLERNVYAAQRTGRLDSFIRGARRLPILRSVDRLPPGLKWQLRRVLARGGSPAGPVLDQALRERLSAELRDDLVRFREWTGQAFNQWSV